MITNINEFKTLISNDITSNEKYIVGNYVVFNFFQKDAFGDLPYRYAGKILDNSIYNRLKVEVIERIILNDNTVKTNNYNTGPYKIGDIINVHVGNIVKYTSNIKSIIKENLVDEIDADLKSKIIQIEKLKDVAHSIKVLCNGEYGDTFLDIENNKVLIVLGDSNPFDSSLKYFILDAIAEYDNQDKISVELENEIEPDNEFNI